MSNARTPSNSATARIDELLPAVRRLRHELHERPETAFEEHQTADRLRDFLKEHAGIAPSHTGIAGTGLLYRLEGAGSGPTRLLRAELDALPLTERTGVPHAAKREGHHHACGHDGHMAMLAGAASVLAADDVWEGTTYLLFQPAEETGQGAAKVLADPAVAALDIDAAFAYHNLPGERLGNILVRPGSMAAASVGLHVRFEGATTHAAAPHQGRNPIPALAVLALRAEAIAHAESAYSTGALVTPIHLEAGAIAYGTAAGAGSVRFTVRADDDETLQRITERIAREADALGHAGSLDVAVTEHERFPATVNDGDAVALVERAADRLDANLQVATHPRPWSEDFGHFTARWPGALIGIGSGVDQAPLHTPGYDFPDALLEPGVRLWLALVQEGDP